MSDILMIENGDGGNVLIQKGDLLTDDTFFTAIYMSLFEGNAFYHLLKDENGEELQGDTTDLEAMFASPSIKSNLNNISNVINAKLNWLITSNIVDSVNTEITEKSEVELQINITVTEPNGNTRTFSLIWDNEKNLLNKFGELYGGLYETIY